MRRGLGILLLCNGLGCWLETPENDEVGYDTDAADGAPTSGVDDGLSGTPTTSSSTADTSSDGTGASTDDEGSDNDEGSTSGGHDTSSTTDDASDTSGTSSTSGNDDGHTTSSDDASTSTTATSSDDMNTSSESTSTTTNGDASTSSTTVDDTTSTTTDGDASTSSTSTDDPSSTSTDADASTSTTSTNSSTSSTTNTSGTTGPDPECTSHSHCGGSTPYCVNAACMGCGAFASAGTSCSVITGSNTPACLPSTGRCVECTVANQLACSPLEGCLPNNTCGACTEHDQCTSGGCDLDVGQCIDEEPIYVDVGGLSCPGEGTRSSPYCTITAGVAAISEGEAGVLRIVPGRYNERIATLGEKTIAMVREGTSGQIELAGTTTVFGGLDNYDSRIFWRHVFANNDGVDGTWNDTGDLWIDDSHIQQRNGIALHLRGGRTTLRRSRIASSGGGREGAGIQVWAEAALHMVNSFVRVDSILLQGAWNALYSSIIAPLSCFEGALLTVRNSIVQDASPDTLFDACPLTNVTFTSTNSPSVAEASGQNNTLVTYSATDFVDTATANLHLTNSGAPKFKSACSQQANDPTTDIDGEERSTNPDTSYRGADMPRLARIR